LGFQSIDEAKMRDFVLTPKSSNDTPAISEISIIPRDYEEIEREFLTGSIPRLGPNIRVVVVSNAREYVVRGAVFSIEVQRKVVRRSRLESTKERIGVVGIEFRA
jgi:hypothetical protein